MDDQHGSSSAPAAPARSGMRLKGWKRVDKGAIIGFANVKLPNSLTLTGCIVWQSGGKRWATLPARPVLRDGRHAIGADGVKQWEQVCYWPSREVADAFSEKLIELVARRDPDAFRAVAA